MLPPAQPRSHLHTRTVVYSGYLREDGLWDIEGELTDTKAHAIDRGERGQLPPGAPVHGMSIRVTLDDHMTVRAIATSMDHTPFDECQQGNDPMQRMVGATMGPGWRQAIDRALGNNKGCTHLREMLFNMATAAFQTVTGHRMTQRRQAGVSNAALEKPPHFVGRCIAWDVDGPVVQRLFPQFVGWQPLKRRG